MAEIYGKIGEAQYVNLLADPTGAEPIAVSLTPGNGAIAAGTVIYREEAGTWAPAKSENVTNQNQLAVLKDAAETGQKPGHGLTAVAPDAVAYRAGRFIDGKVKLAESGTLTAAHKVTLRQQGIVFDQSEGAATFDNKVTGN